MWKNVCLKYSIFVLIFFPRRHIYFLMCNLQLQSVQFEGESGFWAELICFIWKGVYNNSAHCPCARWQLTYHDEKQKWPKLNKKQKKYLSIKYFLKLSKLSFFVYLVSRGNYKLWEIWMSFWQWKTLLWKFFQNQIIVGF